MDNTLASHAQQNVSVVAFKLNRRTFALPLEVIVQILPMMTITPIPHMSRIVKGTINIRGEDVLVVNLRTYFNMEEVDLQLYTPLLLLKIKERSLALLVDSVLDVMNLPAETLSTLANMLPEGIDNVPLLKCVSHFNDDTILVLEPEHLFDDHHVAQRISALRTSALPDAPATDTPVEDALVSPVEEQTPAKKSSARKNQTQKKETALDAPVAEEQSAGQPAAENG